MEIQPAGSARQIIALELAVPVDLAAKPNDVQNARLGAFAFSRFAAAAHILYFHFNFGGRLSGEGRWLANFRSWGSTWVPFFFAVSGFVSTYSQLSKNKAMDVGPITPFLRRRVLSVYPLYAVSLFVPICLDPFTKSTWLSLPFHLALLQAWSPFTSTNCPNCPLIVDAQAFNGNGWYLSALASMWVAWWFIYRFVAAASITCLAWLMVVSASVSFVWPVIIAIGWGGNVPIGPVGFMTWMWPLSSFHIFFCGMILAKLYVERKQCDMVGALQFLAAVEKGMATFSLFVLGLIFCLITTDYNLEVKMRGGGLLPLHLMLIWGLAVEADPLAKLLTKAPFKWTEELAYGVFVLQSVVLRFLSKINVIIPVDGWSVLAQYWACVLPLHMLAALGGNHFIHKPIAAYFK